jgi:hypothetical protein
MMILSAIKESATDVIRKISPLVNEFSIRRSAAVHHESGAGHE